MAGGESRTSPRPVSVELGQNGEFFGTRGDRSSGDASTVPFPHLEAAMGGCVALILVLLLAYRRSFCHVHHPRSTAPTHAAPLLPT